MSTYASAYLVQLDDNYSFPPRRDRSCEPQAGSPPASPLAHTVGGDLRRSLLAGENPGQFLKLDRLGQVMIEVRIARAAGGRAYSPARKGDQNQIWQQLA